MPAMQGVHILWRTAEWSYDSDSVSGTAAERPLIEGIVHRAMPGSLRHLCMVVLPPRCI
jgi:hypothetical protein